jgi:hypothetical protein
VKYVSVSIIFDRLPCFIEIEIDFPTVVTKSEQTDICRKEKREF